MDTKVSSGTAVIDWLLEGGYEKGVITTIYGPAGSGKSNLCLLFLARSIKGEKSVYIDSEGNFSLTRLKQVCPDYKEALERVIFVKPTSFAEQERAIVTIVPELLKKEIGAIIVDSMSLLYRADMKEDDNRELNNSLAMQMRALLEIARKKDIPVIITTQVYADMENKDEVKIVGGTVIRNMSKCLLEIKKTGQNRIALIKKHRSIEEGKSVMFKITDEGIEEVKRN